MPLPSLVRLAPRMEPLGSTPTPTPTPLLLLATVALTACVTLAAGTISVHARQRALTATWLRR